MEGWGGKGCWFGVGRRGEVRGGTNRIGKKQWRFFSLVNDFPFMKLRERCISIQPRWSLHDSAGKWPAVIKQCGGKKHRGIFLGNADIFYCVELHKSQQITKGETNQKHSSAPSVLQNSWAGGMAHPTFVSLRSGPLIDGLRGKLVLVEVLMLTLVAGFRQRSMEHTGSNRRREREGCCLTGQVCNSTS